jgi:hypothetical protein
MFDQSGSPVLSMTVMDTVLGYTGLRRGGRYTWRVIGMRGDEAIDTGAVASFTTVLPVTSVVDGTNEAPTVERSGSAVRLIGADTNVGVVHLYNLQGVLFGRYNVGEWVPLHGLPAGVYVLHTSQAPSSHVLIHWMGGQ